MVEKMYKPALQQATHTPPSPPSPPPRAVQIDFALRAFLKSIDLVDECEGVLLEQGVL